MQIKAEDFNLEATLDSGQVFGFKKDAEGVYEGVIAGHPARLWQIHDQLNVQSAIPEEALINYFDLQRNLAPVYELMRQDEKLAAAAENLRGLRLIRQNSWEALACFIISSNNNVKRIRHIWNNLSSRLSENKNTFPSVANIAKCHERTLRELGLGYRAPFLSRTARLVSKNETTLDAIRQAEYEEARERVIQFPGVGPKVADCVLLYGFQKHEAFPVDVWILRVMRKLYFRNRKVSEEKVRQFGMKRWGKNAGYIQQYLFHGARTGILCGERLRESNLD